MTREKALLLIIFLGCAPTEPVGVETSTGSKPFPRSFRALPQPVMRVGHHPLGEEVNRVHWSGGPKSPHQ